MKTAIAIFAFTIFGSFSLSAQVEDVPNCKDSPMFNRLPNEFIQQCSHNFDALDIPMSLKDGETQFEKKEGTLTFIEYVYYSEAGTEAPSFLQIVKNYENAVMKTSGKRIFYSAEAGMATLYTKSGDKDIWVVLNDFSGTAGGNYQLRILEMEPMKQEISASDMLTALNTSGFIALYINFETGKSEIKAESQPIIDQIVQLLKDNPSLVISIEGHTDNVGTAASNQSLSEKRAQAVMNALIAKGIDKSRLSFKGWGSTKPIGDNGTDDGKAKNRRVEIVKK
jgi:outer membrane protein OmpA-like peptidoglycan-associated protein